MPKKPNLMKSKVLRVFSVMCLCFFFSCTAEAVQWEKTYAGLFNSIRQTSDGGFIAAGYISSASAGGDDFWVVKLNGDGSIAWQKTYGGMGTDNATSVIQTPDGEYVVVATSLGGEGYILKLRSDGSIAWQKKYASTYTLSISKTSDGGYVIAGMNIDKLWVLKLNSDGSATWQKAYFSPPNANSTIAQTSDGGYVIAGTLVPPIMAPTSGWVLKLNADGGGAWGRYYEGGGAFSVSQTSDGGCAIVGWASYGTGSGPFILRLNANGSVAWQKTYSLPGIAFSIQQTSDGGFIVGGGSGRATPGSAWLLRLNDGGSVVWAKSVEGPTGGFKSIQQTSEGGYIAAAGSLVLRVDSTGNIPDCSLISISSAADSDVNAVEEATGGGGLGQDTGYIPQTTAVTPIDTHTTENTLCLFSSACAGLVSFPIMITSVAEDVAGNRKFQKAPETLSGTMKLFFEQGNIIHGDGGCFASFLAADGTTTICFKGAVAISTDVTKNKTGQILLIGTGDFSMNREGLLHSGVVYLDAKGTSKKDGSGEISSFSLSGKISGGSSENFILGGNFRATLTKESTGIGKVDLELIE